MLVLGTAGHVDHGKSTLIKALTGIDPDRLREEKERQMTIDLGFAWLDLPSGKEIGIVDVPGHRDFIENMLAGIGGIDAVLFVIAADEGIMPQTKEHLAIVDLLEIEKGLIVLTKIDTVEDQEWIDLICDDIRKSFSTTSLAHADIIPVSALTGAGLDSLINSIDSLVGSSKTKIDKGKPRLPIDRIFSLKGFGTIVTGTQLDGKFEMGQQVIILPGGIESRIRAIQTHKKKVEVIEPGNRVALNLVGVDVDQLQRGLTVTLPSKYATTRRVDVRFRMIADASGNLCHDDQIKFFSGTTQISARVRLIGSEKVKANEKAWLQLEFDEEILVENGDHYIIRRPSPAETIGGGTILNAHPQQRYKRFSQNTNRLFEMLEKGNHFDRILTIMDKEQFITLGQLTKKMGLGFEEIKKEIDDILAQGKATSLSNDRSGLNENSLLITTQSLKTLKAQIIETISKYHQENPLREGVKKEQLRNTLKIEPRLFQSLLEMLLTNKEIIDRNGGVGLQNHQVVFDKEQIEKIRKLNSLFENAPYAPPSLVELKNVFGEDLVLALISKSELIQTSDQIVFRANDFECMRSFTLEFLEKNGSISIGQFRDHFNTSRKYALSFLEYLDTLGVTDRKEDIRILKSG